MQGETNLPDASSAQLLWTDDLTKPFPEFRRERSESGRTKIFVSGHGKARFHDGSKLHAVPMHVLLANLPFHLPVVVLFREFSDPKYSIEWVGSETLNGASVIHIKCVREDDPVNAAVTAQDWYLDAASGLPVKVAYRVPILRNALKTEQASVEYADFRNESGVLLPFTLKHHPSSGNLETITVSAYSFNVPTSASDFELSGDAQ